MVLRDDKLYSPRYFQDFELYDDVIINRDGESISGDYARMNTLDESYKITSNKNKKVKVLLNKTND